MRSRRPEPLRASPPRLKRSAPRSRQLNAITRLQDDSGLWHTVIDRPDSYLEASSAAGFALALGRALKTGLAGLDRELAQAVYARALGAICANINPSGEF